MTKEFLREGVLRYKVPGGKLLTVKLKFDSRLRDVQILGDFFVFPEDSLPKIEQSLLGVWIDDAEGEICKRIVGAATSNGVQMIGVTPEAIAHAVKQAVK